ncbi:OmpA family protein [bacterium]|nr:OmpA family protein [bacterium]
MAIGARKAGSGGGGGGEGEGNVFWTTMSDLMLGLAIIFMVLFTLAMTGFSTEKVEQKQEQIKASQELIEKLDKEEIKAQVDEMTGDIKISDLELFELNSWNLSPRGKQYLDKLVPIYVDTIFAKEELLESIENIIVQGHTDSQSFSGISSKDEQFAKNMELSLKRANSVAEYMLKTNYNKAHSEKLKKMLVVEGRSFNDPIITNGIEDYAKSRRVELKLEVKEWNIAKALGF